MSTLCTTDRLVMEPSNLEDTAIVKPKHLRVSILKGKTAKTGIMALIPSSVETQGRDNELRACHLLDMPPEVRNHVYELVLAPDPCNDFVQAKPPSKSLVLTCGQICAETNEMYKASYRAFWSGTEFTFSLDYGPGSQSKTSEEEFRNFLEKTRDEDIEHVTFIRINVVDSDSYYVRKNGVWHIQFPSVLWKILVVPAKASSPRTSCRASSRCGSH